MSNNYKNPENFEELTQLSKIWDDLSERVLNIAQEIGLVRGMSAFLESWVPQERDGEGEDLWITDANGETIVDFPDRPGLHKQAKRIERLPELYEALDKAALYCPMWLTQEIVPLLQKVRDGE